MLRGRATSSQARTHPHAPRPSLQQVTGREGSGTPAQQHSSASQAKIQPRLIVKEKKEQLLLPLITLPVHITSTRCTMLISHMRIARQTLLNHQAMLKL